MAEPASGRDKVIAGQSHNASFASRSEINPALGQKILSTVSSACPTVSVIIPTYNHRDYVCATIESVLAQTFRDFELIVVNDGSPDDTASILSPFIERRLIRYIEQPNAGQAAARNRGLREACGRYIAFLDDDDLWPADKLSWQVAELENNPALSAVAGDQVQEGDLPEKTAATRPAVHLDHEEMFRGNPFVSPGQLLIRRDDLQQLGGLSEKIWGADDFDLYLRLASRKPIKFERRVSLFYRVHAGNASNDRPRMLQNCGKCLRLRLGELPLRRRIRLGRLSYRWMYEYLGRDMLRGGGVSKGNARTISGAVEIIRCFMPHLLCDPRLSAAIVRDLLFRRRANAGC